MWASDPGPAGPMFGEWWDYREYSCCTGPEPGAHLEASATNANAPKLGLGQHFLSTLEEEPVSTRHRQNGEATEGPTSGAEHAEQDDAQPTVAARPAANRGGRPNALTGPSPSSVSEASDSHSSSAEDDRRGDSLPPTPETSGALPPLPSLRRRWPQFLAAAAASAAPLPSRLFSPRDVAVREREANAPPVAQVATVTAASDPALREAGVLIRGSVFHVKGWWRKGPKLGERLAEIRLAPSGKEHQLVWYRLSKDGQPEETKARRIESLRGAVAERVDIPEHPNLHFWRLFLLPQDREEHMDFAASSAEDRDSWLQALAEATARLQDPSLCVSGSLHLSILDASLLWEPPALRIQAAAAPEVFGVAQFEGMAFRTAPRRLQGPVMDGCNFWSVSPDFARSAEIPVADDDPDSLVTLELWSLERGRKAKQHGRIDVPLYCFGRNVRRELRLPVRDPLRPKGEGSEVGTITVEGIFRQPFCSLLLPRPPRHTPGPNWTTVGDKPIREQLREFEAFLKEFEMFSSRFMYHCDTWRDIGFMLRRLVHWDSPLLTLACLVAFTLVIVFLHQYSVAITVFVLLLCAGWQHPCCRRLRAVVQERRSRRRAAAAARRHAALLQPRRRWCRCWWAPCGAGVASCGSRRNAAWCCRGRGPAPRTGDAQPLGSPEEASGPNSTPQGSSTGTTPPAPPQVQERFENERRLTLGRFTARRLRFYDPPPWCDPEGHRAEPPRQVEGGVSYIWRIEVSPLTDSDGWQYARSFGRNVVWRSTFNHQSFVRRRRHVGRPILPPTGAGGSALEATAQSLASVTADTVTHWNSARSVWTAPTASTQPVASAAAPHMPLNPRTSSASMQPSASGKGNAPEFGLAKTPFHDMYQQYLMRWSVLQRQMEYWMDWYERRKNLLLGRTSSTHNIALLGISVILAAACVLPTRMLALLWIYTFFYDGLSQGRLMRKNRDTFISALKDTAQTLWLEAPEMRARAEAWGPKTELDEMTDSGVQLLVLRDWIRSEFFDGRPMVPLRAVQRCSTLGELAQQVTWMSDRFARRRSRQRVWWRSTFRNLLEHVPSDATLFQPLTCQGLGDGSY